MNGEDFWVMCSGSTSHPNLSRNPEKRGRLDDINNRTKRHLEWTPFCISIKVPRVPTSHLSGDEEMDRGDSTPGIEFARHWIDGEWTESGNVSEAKTVVHAVPPYAGLPA